MPRVLIVEDRAATREGLVRLLEQQGFETVSTANGVEALEYLQGGGPADVILLDLLMPRMDGWTFRREQLRDPWLADIPVITLSIIEGRPLEALQAARSLQKPIDASDLIRAVQDLCDRQTQMN